MSEEIPENNKLLFAFLNFCLDYFKRKVVYFVSTLKMG